MDPPRETMPVMRRAVWGTKSIEDGGVDGEVVDALLGLLDEGVAVEFPGEVFDASVDFFEGLVDGNGADGDGGISDDPLAGGVDVFSSGKIHDGVGSPLGGPAHFLDFLIDGGSDGGVADVGVDFYEEIPPDDHGFDFGVIDISRDDGATASDFGTNEFRSDGFGNFGTEGLSGVLVIHHIAADLLKGVDFRRGGAFHSLRGCCKSGRVGRGLRWGLFRGRGIDRRWF